MASRSGSGPADRWTVRTILFFLRFAMSLSLAGKWSPGEYGECHPRKGESLVPGEYEAFWTALGGQGEGAGRHG